MVTTEGVSFDVELGPGAASTHLGLITLNTDETTEYDFHGLLPPDSGVMFYTSRIVTVNPVTLENLQKMGPQLSHAASLILPDITLKAIAYSCTSGTLALGYDKVKALVRYGLPAESRDQVEVVTPLTAAIDAFRSMGLSRIAMVTPYMDSVNQPMINFFASQGIEVIKLKSLLVESDVDIARVQPDSIQKAAYEACVEEADALFLSCTALRAVECIVALESALKKPVLSSNLCMFWALMKASGYNRPIDGCGQLLAQHL
jgi:maleate isomerase